MKEADFKYIVNHYNSQYKDNLLNEFEFFEQLCFIDDFKSLDYFCETGIIKITFLTIIRECEIKTSDLFISHFYDMKNNNTLVITFHCDQKTLEFIYNKLLLFTPFLGFTIIPKEDWDEEKLLITEFKFKY